MDGSDDEADAVSSSFGDKVCMCVSCGLRGDGMREIERGESVH